MIEYLKIWGAVLSLYQIRAWSWRIGGADVIGLSQNISVDDGTLAFSDLFSMFR